MQVYEMKQKRYKNFAIGGCWILNEMQPIVFSDQRLTKMGFKVFKVYNICTGAA